jgi:ATP-dependent Clp protease ATP-binding subunit ClpA
MTSKPFDAAAHPFDRFTANAQQLLAVADALARATGSSHVGTEHVLMAAFTSGFQSATVLRALRIKQTATRLAIERATGGHKRASEAPAPTAGVQHVVEHAFRWAKSCGDTRVGTKHVLHGLSAESAGVAALVLADLGVTRAQIEFETQRITEPEP